MALEVSPEEYQRWQDHLRRNPLTTPKGWGSKIPENKKQKIINGYKGGKSIHRLHAELQVSKHSIRGILRRAELKS